MTAKPGSQKVYLYRGDPWSMTISSQLDGVDETVTAANAKAQIRASVDATEVLATMNVTVDGTGKVVTLSLTPAETAAIAPGDYVWDFQPDPAGETWLKGAVQVEGDVSR